MPCLFVDNLTVIDCSILDPDRGLIGASWAVDIELHGDLDHQSMVFDFAKAKKTIKTIVDNEVDHKLVVPCCFKGVSLHGDETLHIRFTDNNGEILEHTSPSTAVCRINTQRISRDAIINYLTDTILSALPTNVQQLSIMLRKETTSGHYYRYSHGLKKHDGNCQRIAHGHRSQIQIWKNGQRSDTLEKSIAERWHDIYLGTKDDIVSQGKGRIQFSYTTDQGEFAIELADHRVYLMDCDSTVECIAEHLLEMSGEQHHDIKVKAFEGIGKGAVAFHKPEI